MILQYTDSGILYQDHNAVPMDFEKSIRYCLEYLQSGLIKNGPTPVTVDEAFVEVVNADIYFLIGHSFIAGFDVGYPWQYKDKFLCEEFFGPRSQGYPVDMQEFTDAAETLARFLECRWLEFGTRASTKPLALGRLAERSGCRVASVTLQKEIP